MQAAYGFFETVQLIAQKPFLDLGYFGGLPWAPVHALDLTNEHYQNVYTLLLD